ncbi:MAG: hypothetical protein GF418_14410, partial [Chitinivibrionales bacterium]|nr:hypothetical protein [Chitinivibrionales bacterium]MBD3396813.1 hypothetical protein [Chitinivibrionales bacterium]
MTFTMKRTLLQASISFFMLPGALAAQHASDIADTVRAETRVVDTLSGSDTLGDLPADTAASVSTLPDSSGAGDSVSPDSAALDSLANDSLRADPLVPDTASALDTTGATRALVDSLHRQLGAAGSKDTAEKFYDSPFVGFGAGWTLGSMRLFDEWQDGLPDSIGDMPDYNEFADSFEVAFSEQEPPEAYSTAFPLSLSFTPLVKKKGHLSITASFWWMEKDYLA